ncbi:MAG: C69 family dipeptidase [Bacteroidales bacterium]|nr:C69 family dipeptidase [Candidatus Physcousia equi]
MKKYIFLLLSCLLASAKGSACTNLIVGKKASADGSTIVSYSSDSFGAYGYLFSYPHALHKPGDTRLLYHYETNNYLGEIPEVAETYNVIGLVNEHQLTIFETTWGGREELWEGEGIMDYGSLMTVTLQRAKTAREAIKVLTDLATTYGYISEGESFTLADPNEIWILDMVGKGKGVKGCVWVAVRVPDDCISAHANQSRIRQFAQTKKFDKKLGYYTVGDSVCYSKDVISFAREKGYFTGKDAEFSFCDAYNPLDFSGARFCEARVWSFFNKWAADDMSAYLDYAKGENLNHPFPLFVRPKQKLTVQDVKDMMRDHYEGTPLEMQSDLGMGPYEMPYRPTPLTYEVDGKKYFNERPISTQQASCIYVSQMRSWLPNHIGCCLWFGNDDANMVAMVPIYCSMKEAPVCFHQNTADTFHFSFRSAYWLCNWVSNMVYQRYSLLFPELQAVRDKLEKTFNASQSDIEQQAKGMAEDAAKRFLSDYSSRLSGMMADEWMQLAQTIIVKYNDMAVKKTDSLGNYLKTPGGVEVPVERPGYPERYRRTMVKEAGKRYAVPE